MWARLGSQASLSTLALDDDHFEGKDMERTVFNLVPGLPQWLRFKESACNARDLGLIPESWQPTQVFLPGESP